MAIKALTKFLSVMCAVSLVAVFPQYAHAASVIQQVTAKGDSVSLMVTPPFDYETRLYKNPPSVTVIFKGSIFPAGNKIYQTAGQYVKQVRINSDPDEKENIKLTVDLKNAVAASDVHVQRNDDGVSIQVGNSPEPAAVISETPEVMKPAAERPASTFVISPSETTLSARKVTQKLRNTPLIDIMDAISRQTGASFIVEDKIQQRKFSAIMENVNLRDALRALLEAQGLGYEQIGESNTFVIKEYSETRSRLATRIFRLKYTQLTNIPTPQINLGGGSSKGGFSAVALTKEARPAADDKDGGGFISVIQSALTDKGRIQVYAETNSLIISDIPENFPNIEELIEKLDTPVPQVMIEVYFVETTVDTSKNLGISYGTDGTLAQFQGNSQLVNFPLTMNGSAAGFPAMDWSQFSKGSAYVVNSNAYFGGVSFGILSFQQLVATLKAVMTDGQGQFLAKPKVMTLNNKAAQIAVTADTVVEFDVKQFTGAGYLGEQSKTAKRQETGITLWVTPQVNEGGTITLTLTPQISRPQNSTFFPTDKVVDTQKRSITTTIRVSDGSTVLIGGLLSNEDSNTTQKVPILGDIPIIGKLFFSQVNDKKSKRELLIFITPKIVKNNG